MSLNTGIYIEVGGKKNLPNYLTRQHFSSGALTRRRFFVTLIAHDTQAR
jgi:hypothetical protein